MPKQNHILAGAAIVIFLASIVGLRSVPSNTAKISPVSPAPTVASASATPTVFLTPTNTPSATPTEVLLHYGGKVYKEVLPTVTTTH